VAGLAPMLGMFAFLASCSRSIGAFRAGMLKFGVRWKTTSEAACRAMSGID
jgi:hypothetical protein